MLRNQSSAARSFTSTRMWGRDSVLLKGALLCVCIKANSTKLRMKQHLCIGEQLRSASEPKGWIWSVQDLMETVTVTLKQDKSGWESDRGGQVRQNVIYCVVKCSKGSKKLCRWGWMCCHRMINAGFWGDSPCFIKHFHAGFSAPLQCSGSGGATQYPCEISVLLWCLYMLVSPEQSTWQQWRTKSIISFSLFFAAILKQDWMLQRLKQEGEDEKLQLRQDVRVHINTLLLGMPLMASSSDKEGNLSVGLWDKHWARRLTGFIIPWAEPHQEKDFQLFFLVFLSWHFKCDLLWWPPWTASLTGMNKMLGMISFGANLELVQDLWTQENTAHPYLLKRDD